MTTESPNSETRKAAMGRQWLGEDVSAGTNQHTTIKEMLVVGVIFVIRAEAS
jgi:hypothetical protein